MEIIPPKILVTKDYKIFSFFEFNRPKKNTNNLEKSICQLDLTSVKPILVDPNMRIIDGQHRFFACVNLGLPIYYIIIDVNVDKAMILLNGHQSLWRQNEYLNFHSIKSFECYNELKKFDDKYKIGISNSTVVFPEKQINSKTIKGGKDVFSKSKYADIIAEFLISDEIKSLKFYKTRPFVVAVRKAISELYTSKQIEKLKRNALKIPQCANYEQYLVVFGNIIKK